MYENQFFLNFIQFNVCSKVNVTFWHKPLTGNFFRQFIKLENVDFCGVLSNMNIFPAMKKLLFVANVTFPGLIHLCPYEGVRNTDRERKNYFVTIY